MAVFKKQGVYWIDYYVHGRRKRERIGQDKRLAERGTRQNGQVLWSGSSVVVRFFDHEIA